MARRVVPGRVIAAVVVVVVVAAIVAIVVAASTSHSASVPHLPDSPPKTRLRIKNACEKEPIWIAHESGSGVGPDPQNLKIKPGEYHDFEVDDNLQSTRYWPKMRCDAEGNACLLGGSGGPGESCSGAYGCGPPVDTKFEATFGQTGKPCNTSAQEYKGCDWLDMSLVDGFTLPFKLQIWGDCAAKYANATKVSRVVDCSALSFDECPTSENMGAAGTSVDLQVRSPGNGSVVGCYSPCSKLSFRNWNNTLAMNHTPDDAVAKDYCCPTPPESPLACRAGPVVNTSFVKMVHRACPGVYGYSYDDGMGLTTCPAGTRYEVSFFCPDGLSSFASQKNNISAAHISGKQQESITI